MRKVLFSLVLVLAILVVGCKVSAENFCCNPETYICEDCGFCPNPDCSTCDFEGSYDLQDANGNVVGTVHIIKTDEVVFMYQCFIVGNHSKCTGYFLKNN